MTEKEFWTPVKVESYLKSLSDKSLILPDNIYCTNNFKWNEVLCLSRRRITMPNIDILRNLYYVTSVLQVYRDIIRTPFWITSGWRTADEQNNLVRMYASGKLKNKPSKTSLHLEGLALDFVVSGSSQRLAQNIIDKTLIGEAEFGFDYTHIGLTTFSKAYLQRQGVYNPDIYRKLCINKCLLTDNIRSGLIKRLNPKNWQSLQSSFSISENNLLFENRYNLLNL